MASTCPGVQVLSSVICVSLSRAGARWNSIICRASTQLAEMAAPGCIDAHAPQRCCNRHTILLVCMPLGSILAVWQPRLTHSCTQKPLPKSIFPAQVDHLTAWAECAADASAPQSKPVAGKAAPPPHHPLGGRRDPLRPHLLLAVCVHAHGPGCRLHDLACGACLVLMC